MPKLYQHQQEGTYYTRLYWPGVSAIVTRQIHPDGVRLLKRRGVRLEGEIPLHLIDELKERNWLATKEEIPRWGIVDWAPHWHLIDAPSRPKPRPFPKENPFITARRERECAAAEAERRKAEEAARKQAEAERRAAEEAEREKAEAKRAARREQQRQYRARKKAEAEREEAKRAARREQQRQYRARKKAEEEAAQLPLQPAVARHPTLRDISANRIAATANDPVPSSDTDGVQRVEPPPSAPRLAVPNPARRTTETRLALKLSTVSTRSDKAATGLRPRGEAAGSAHKAVSATRERNSASTYAVRNILFQLLAYVLVIVVIAAAMATIATMLD